MIKSGGEGKVCVCLCECLCICVGGPVCVGLWVFVHGSVCVWVWVSVGLSVCLCPCAENESRVHTCVCVCVRTHTFDCSWCRGSCGVGWAGPGEPPQRSPLQGGWEVWATPCPCHLLPHDPEPGNCGFCGSKVDGLACRSRRGGGGVWSSSSWSCQESGLFRPGNGTRETGYLWPAPSGLPAPRE